MSIYATWLSIEDIRQEAAELRAAGIGVGVIAEGIEDAEDESQWEANLDPEEFDAPIIYKGSHVLPSDDDPRGGFVSVSSIPDHITRDGRDDAPEGSLKDWLRLDMKEHPDTYHGLEPGMATVVLTRPQVERLRDTLTNWLEAKERW